MANDEHVNAVLQGARAIAAWRDQHPGGVLDLSGANLRRADLPRANLNGADLREANLEWGDLRWADLIGADLSGVNLSRADFQKADLAGARLPRANLADANLEDANCRGVQFDSAICSHTRFLNADLAGARGLAASKHVGPSVLDSETLMKSGHLPSQFLRGCGLSEAAIKATYAGDTDGLAAKLAAEGDYYSCFISYSSKNEAFAEKLLHDLQERGVRCWYAPKDMPIGARILDTIYDVIRQRERLLLIFSEHSVRSEWVRDEVEQAFAEERDRGETVIFPIRLDDAVMHSNAAWAEKIRQHRHIGDFRAWQDAVAYDAAVARLLRDLARPQRAE
ncbi:MAG: toll/interleukin-1 receptor domain-containing protein [Planctomycetota bacterium]